MPHGGDQEAPSDQNNYIMNRPFVPRLCPRLRPCRGDRRDKRACRVRTPQIQHRYIIKCGK
jgi:hypothetical protein